MNSPEEPKLITIMTALLLSGIGDALILGLYVLSFYYLGSSIYLAYFHPLAKFPGPKIAAISRLPFMVTAVRGETYKWLDELHEKYGPVVRIAPGELTTISPGSWKDIYLKRPQRPKDPHSQTPPMNGADSLFTADGHTHTRMRRTFANAFSDKALREQSQIIESYADLLIDRLRRETKNAASREQGIDLSKYYGYAALEIIADLTFGESFNGLQGDNEHDWISGFFLGAKFGAIRNSLSYFYPLDRLFGLVFLRLTAKNRSRNWSYTSECVTKRLAIGAAGIERPDFMMPVIGNVNEDREKGITRDELNTNSLALVIAGRQLTTVALATATYLLLKEPEKYQRLQQELRSSFTGEKELSVTSIQSLPYLAAVVDETLRIHHPTPIHLPRIIGPDGQMVDGQWIPGNTIIGLALQTAQTSKADWEDPCSFCPECFLPPGHQWYESRFERDNKEAFHPFSIGNRNCLGGK
ncbi:cytochrome P450 [Ustulina deusta]|nr:cytochrome P450 [Ustulina deusta]